MIIYIYLNQTCERPSYLGRLLDVPRCLAAPLGRLRPPPLAGRAVLFFLYFLFKNIKSSNAAVVGGVPSRSHGTTGRPTTRGWHRKCAKEQKGMGDEREPRLWFRLEEFVCGGAGWW